MDKKDSTGAAIWEAFNGRYAFEVVERDDGFVTGGLASQYFMRYKDWEKNEKAAMRFVKGKVLDIGCGAGKHSAYLQEKGFKVTCIDKSPLAINVCRKRGLDARVIPIDKIVGLRQKFDTILLLGGNWGLLQNRKKATSILNDLCKITSVDARIIAESSNPMKLDPFYRKSNLKKGRMQGQRRIRIRFRDLCSDWFDYLGVTKREMEDMLRGSGWKVRRYLESERAYIAVIDRSDT